MSSTQHMPPQNLKEALISAIPNCTTMVLGMMTMNLWIYGHLTWMNFWGALLPIYATAFCLDLFFIGPLVLRVLGRANKLKYMPLLRVGLMAMILTALAPVIETGYAPDFVNYLLALPRNYIVALILQVFVAYRFGSYVLARYRLVKSSVNVAK